MDKIAGLMHVDESGEDLSCDEFDEPEFHFFIFFLEVLNNIEDVGPHDIEN